MPSEPSSARQLVIRADASKTIGGGHVTRCLSLAGALRARGWRCTLMTGEETAATVALPDWLGEIPDRADLLIVDHYGLSAPWERAARSWAKKILIVDDLADRPHDGDLLLDQTAGRRDEDYRALVPAHCRLLLGPSYALLRPEFAQGPKRPATPGRRLLINFGAADPKNIAGFVLKALAASGEGFDADVVCGASAEHIPSLQAVASRIDGDITIHGQVANMVELMAKADLAIGAGGSASWERCALGLPSIVLTLADNQAWTARVLAEAGAALNPGISDAASEALTLLGDHDRLAALSAKAAALCDGRGAERVADIIESQG